MAERVRFDDDPIIASTAGTMETVERLKNSNRTRLYKLNENVKWDVW